MVAQGYNNSVGVKRIGKNGAKILGNDSHKQQYNLDRYYRFKEQ